MNTTIYNDALLPLAGEQKAPATKRPSLFKRIGQALIASRVAQAERELRRVEAVYGINVRDIYKTPSVSKAGLPFQSERD
jgi:hypothetical protein